MLRRRHFMLVVFAATAPGFADDLTYTGPLVIEGARLVARPGGEPQPTSILIRDGRIAAIGGEIELPPGVRHVQASDLLAYAGFVEPFTRTAVADPDRSAKREERVEGVFPSISEQPQIATVEGNRNGIFARLGVADYLTIEPDTFEALREGGFAAAFVAPARAILGGAGGVVVLDDGPLRHSLLHDHVAQTASFARPSRAIRDRATYPGTPLGVSAHLRQFLSDVSWFREMRAYAERHGDPRREVPFDPDLEAFLPVLAGQTPLFWEVDDENEAHRALDFAEEFGLRIVLVAKPQAAGAAERLKRMGVPIVVSLKLPEKPRDFKLEPKDLRKKPGDRTLFGANWSKRPFHPQAAYDAAKARRDAAIAGVVALEHAGVDWCFSAAELKKAADALDTVQEYIDGGLPAEAALRALTTSPAKLLHAEQDLGSVAVGKLANLTLLTKPLGEKGAQVAHVLVGGAHYAFDTKPAKSLDRRAGRQRAGREPPKDPNAEEAPQSAPAPATEEAESDDEEPGEGDEQKDKDDEEAPPASPLDDLLLHEPAWPIETDGQREPSFRTGGSVLLKNATVLPVSSDPIENACVLIERGKITRVGKDVAAPPGVREIDLGGYFVMPGIIDPHAHIALSAVNEWSMSVTPEVRCADVIEPDDPAIYRALSGGTTTIHTMHGSANTIGGQNIILKLKYGRPAEELIFDAAPRTVKFALGENVKRPGMRERGGDDDRPRRFPGSRMGVEATLRRALHAGRQYGEQRAAHEAGVRARQDIKPLRRDLRLEALADIVAGDIWVNCHCYRADEILRLLNVAEELGFRIGALHHVLEGYRVAPEIARHGCGTATFSDWWAYKMEAYEAVPQNAGMLLRAGVNSAIKSDSGDLMRHMNTEAAKCMKYSALTPDEALGLITLNGAALFGLADRVGSLEVGKDGDVAVFDGHPLDTFAKCVVTLIDGEVYFTHREFEPDATRPSPRPAKQFAAARKLGTTDVRAASGPQHGTNSDHGTNGRAAAGYAIVNATLHPISGPDIAGGTLVIEGPRIVALGADTAAPAGYEIIDGRGLHVWPGLINAASNVGMSEVGQATETVDVNEPGDFHPDLTAVSALNPHSAMIEVTRAEGVLTALLVASAPTIAGQAGLIDLDGWSLDEMLIEPKVGLVVNLPSGRADGIVEREERERGPRGRGDGPDRAAEQLERVERLFRDAKLYAEAVRAARQADAEPPIPTDPRFDALIPYVTGAKPTLFRADGYKQILEALLFAEQLELKPILVGGRDAWKLADTLAARGVPVIYDGAFSLPGGVPGVRNASDAWDANYRALSVLADAGVKFCLSAPSASLAKLVTYEAGFAVAHGLDPQVAIRAATLSAAEILGVEDRLGSLEPGKIANVIVTTDHPCQLTNVVERAFIRGRPISLESKHTRNAAKFAGRPAPPLAPPRADPRGPASRTKPAGS